MNWNTFTDIESTKAIVYVANKRLEFFSLRLEQAYGEHHSFVIKADFDALGQSFMNNPTEHFKLIGQAIDIDLQQRDGNMDAYIFRGVIQEVAVQGHEGTYGHLVLRGTSPTILMDRGKCYNVFSNLTLKQMVLQLTKKAVIDQKDYFPIDSNPMYMGQIKFLMQYDESDWQFLRRLSWASKENLYWTGSDLVFGTLKDFPILKATYGREITDFRCSSRHLPESDNTRVRGKLKKINDADNHINSDDEEVEGIVEEHTAKELFESNMIDISSIKNMIEQERIDLISQTVHVKGTSKTLHPRIGRLLKIQIPSGKNGTAELGTFRITKVVHEFNQNDCYKCHFEGVPADVKYCPLSDVKMPDAKSVLGTIVSNEDPDKQGRIKVNFPFASDGTDNVWLKVITPDAGINESMEKNKSTAFIPEPGDQVMVGFESDDPNRPYVMGYMLHGKYRKDKRENDAKNTHMSQRDYEQIVKVRDEIYDSLDLIGQAIGDIKRDFDETQQIMLFRIILEFLLLVARTEKGKKMFLGLLEYVKDIDPELSNEYWKIYDEQNRDNTGKWIL